jgi:hypothetical protein
VLTTACAINTEPIASTTPDAGNEATTDAGFTGAPGDDAGSPAAIICDIDLRCSDDCAEDLDCFEGNDLAERPDYDGLQAQQDEMRATGEQTHTISLEPLEDAWIALPEVNALTLMRVEALDAPVVLAIYLADGDWPLMVRSHDEVSVAWAMAPDQPLVLRIHALEAVEDLAIDMRW